MFQKKAQDRNSIKDNSTNRRGEAYNQAVVTVRQNLKEQELMQGALANVMQMQMIQSQKQELMDLVAKVDLQQKLLDNKMMAAEAPPLPGGLPPMPGEGLPMMPPMGGDPMMGGMPPPPMDGMPPMGDPGMGGMPPMPPPEMGMGGPGGMPMNMMPPV